MRYTPKPQQQLRGRSPPIYTFDDAGSDTSCGDTISETEIDTLDLDHTLSETDLDSVDTDTASDISTVSSASLITASYSSESESYVDRKRYNRKKFARDKYCLEPMSAVADLFECGIPYKRLACGSESTNDLFSNRNYNSARKKNSKQHQESLLELVRTSAFEKSAVHENYRNHFQKGGILKREHSTKERKNVRFTSNTITPRRTISSGGGDKLVPGERRVYQYYEESSAPKPLLSQKEREEEVEIFAIQERHNMNFCFNLAFRVEEDDLFEI